MPLHSGLFIETNPAPAKYALSLLGKCAATTVRLPIVLPIDGAVAGVRDAMVHAGLRVELDGGNLCRRNFKNSQ